MQKGSSNQILILLITSLILIYSDLHTLLLFLKQLQK